MNVKRLVPFFLILSSFACGGSGGDGDIVLAVKNARGPEGFGSEVAGLATAGEGLPEVLRVHSFRVVVSGEDFSPIETVFPGDTKEGTITGIPVGSDRTVLIEALNETGETVRRREVTNVEILGSRPTQVVAALVAVPRLTNVHDGSVVPTTRLVLEGYGEPAGGLEIIDHFAGASYSLSSASDTGGLVTPSLSVGFFSFRPSLLSPGLHSFEIRDSQTGESSSVTVTLVSSGRRPGVWIGSAGAVGTKVTMVMGTSEKFDRSVFNLPQVMEALKR